MNLASSFGYRHAPRIVALLAWVVLAWSVLVLLAFVVQLLLGAHGVPTLEGPHLAPFRWSELDTIG